jgi:hypothetical protein
VVCSLFVADPKGWFVMESGGGMTSVSTINILERDLSVKGSELGKSAQSIQNQSRIAFFRGQLRRAMSMLKYVGAKTLREIGEGWCWEEIKS